MADAIGTYSTAKGYVQSAYLIVTSPDRYQVPDDTSFVLSYHMLLGFAVELYLKSYLMHHGHAETDLRKPGVRHSLRRLLDLCATDGLTLPEADRLVDYLNEQHGNFEYRYVNRNGSYEIRWQADVFRELNKLDAYVDGEIGASTSLGRTPSSDGWTIPASMNGWRIPR